MRPRISIITPSFNQAGFIERTIESVLSQGWPDMEYIVVDGGSTDGTLDILKKYPGRLRWISEKDRGQSDAINKGIRMSSGDIVAYLCSDDLYEPGALKLVAAHFQANPSTMWVTGRCRIIDESDKEVRGAIAAYKDFFLRRYSYKTLLVTNYISQPATFLGRRVLDEFGLFDETHHRVMDYEYWLRIGRKYPPAVLDDYLASFRVHVASKTSSGFRQTFREEYEVSKLYSDSRLVDAAHFMSYKGICAAYSLLETFKKKGTGQ